MKMSIRFNLSNASYKALNLSPEKWVECEVFGEVNSDRKAFVITLVDGRHIHLDLKRFFFTSDGGFFVKGMFQIDNFGTIHTANMEGHLVPR